MGFFSIMVYRIVCAQTVAPSLAICEGLGSHAETVATALISTAVRGLVRSVSEVGLEVRLTEIVTAFCLSFYIEFSHLFKLTLSANLAQRISARE